MKYTIMGFFQMAACELGLDLGDLAILRWFVDFKDSGKMKVKIMQGDKYYWVSYKSIVQDIPVLNIQKDAVYRRLRKLCQAGVLKKRTVFEFGTFSYFALDKNYKKLISFNSKAYRPANKNKCDLEDESLLDDNSFLDDDSLFDYKLDASDIGIKTPAPNYIGNYLDDISSNSADFFEDDFATSFDDVKLSDNRVRSSVNPVDFKPHSVDFKPRPVDLNQQVTVQKPKVTDEKPNIPVQKPKQNINLLNYSIKSDTRAQKGNPSKSLANLLLSLIRKNNPNFKTPNMKNWIRTFDAILNFDNRDPREVSDLIKWVHTESAFWSCQILNPSNLRNQYDRLICRKNYEENKFVPKSPKQTAYNKNQQQAYCKFNGGPENVENSIVINSIYGSYSLVGFEDI